MNFGLCLPSGTIFKDNENICSCDLISYDDFINELDYLFKHCNYKREGVYTYYEGHNKIYEINYKSKGE